MKQKEHASTEKIPYLLTRRRGARSVRVSVFPGGEVRVSAPLLLPKAHIERFLEEKRSWIMDQILRMEHVSKKKTKKEAREAYLMYKEEARALVVRRLEFFNRHYGLTYARVAIRDQHSRWGSCSRKGNLNFNYRLARIPPLLADYVIVHELCHLKEFNHGPRFWSLVAECIPNYEELRAVLHHHKHN